MADTPGKFTMSVDTHDRFVAVSGCSDCPMNDVEVGRTCGFSMRKGEEAVVTSDVRAPDNCPLRKGRVILFLNEKREG